MKILTKATHGLKVLVLSDLHIFSQKDIITVENLLEELKNNNYDAIYLVGDIIDATNILNWDNVSGRLLELMSFLGHIAPTYIVYGSHDLAYRTTSKKNPWLKDEVTFKERFLDKIAGFNGINVLENETKTLDANKEYTISGINPSLDYAMTTPDGNTEILLKEKERYEFLNNLNANQTNTLLCHYPNAVMDLYNHGLLPNVNLSVAGHNHNGCTQFKFIPVEDVLDLFKNYHRGLITPGKSVKPKDTANLRGVTVLDSDSLLLINPSVKTFAACTGPLAKLDWMFYKGYSEIEYIPENKLSR